ncbi:hypothetical protein Taro_050764 [Colocasia esculenta]|uniref:NAD(P)H dehydrogenase (quinone) n=1 Tax=Colocasia esculenta TaxID=4460 RepID=A0A843XEN0_COLES|nr:hypothetical protein [Colocasia esculenta]
MGKGGGCVPSKKKLPGAVAEHSSHDGVRGSAAAPVPVEDKRPDSAAGGVVPPPHVRNLRIFIVFYSMYGHVEALARRMKRGVDGIDGLEGLLFRVPETLPGEVLEQMKAPPKDPDIPVIGTAAELAEADGVLFGFPTRFGCMAAQMKAFFDETGQLWTEQKLVGKPAGFFVSTGTQGGGQETTA